MTVTLGLIFVASLRKAWPRTFLAVRCLHCPRAQIVHRGTTARGTPRSLCQPTRCPQGSVRRASAHRGGVPAVQPTMLDMRLNARGGARYSAVVASLSHPGAACTPAASRRAGSGEHRGAAPPAPRRGGLGRGGRWGRGGGAGGPGVVGWAHRPPALARAGHRSPPRQGLRLRLGAPHRRGLWAAPSAAGALGAPPFLHRFWGGLHPASGSRCAEPRHTPPLEARAAASDAGTLQLHGAGATFPAPLYKKWLEEYQKRHPDVQLSYDAIGSGEGTKRFMAGTVDFGASDAAMSDEEMAAVTRGVRLLPTVAGSIVLAYNLDGLGGDLKLTRDVYVDIFLGKIKVWDDPRIKAANARLRLPHDNIALVVRQDSSGTTYAFTNHLSAVSGQWRDHGPGVGRVIAWPGNSMVAPGNEGVAGRIKHSKGAIGYVEYGMAQRAGLTMAWLENKAGQVHTATRG